MAGSKAKRLGNGFEYEIRDMLREATGNMSFERVPTSGAFVGGQNIAKAKTLRADATEIMAGDLITPQDWRWCVECKNHVDIPVHSLFLGEAAAAIDAFLDQISTSAVIAKRQPLLMMKLRKNPAKFSKKIKETIEAAKIPLPQTKTVTLGTLVAERFEHSNDIAHINHIVYTGVLGDGTKATWRFFDLENWIKTVKDRQYL